MCNYLDLLGQNPPLNTEIEIYYVPWISSDPVQLCSDTGTFCTFQPANLVWAIQMPLQRRLTLRCFLCPRLGWNDVICLPDSSPPLIPGCRMVARWVLLPDPTRDVFSICASLDCIVVPKQTSSPQLGEEQLDHVDKCAWLECICLQEC